MPKITVAKDICKACELCIGVCPNHLIRMSQELNKKGNHFAEQIDETACTGCRLCGIMCPDLAIEVYK